MIRLCEGWQHSLSTARTLLSSSSLQSHALWMSFMSMKTVGSACRDTAAHRREQEGNTLADGAGQSSVFRGTGRQSGSGSCGLTWTQNKALVPLWVVRTLCRILALSWSGDANPAGSTKSQKDWQGVSSPHMTCPAGRLSTAAKG